MNYKKLLRPFRTKMKMEALMKALICGLAMGLLTALVSTVIMRFRYGEYFINNVIIIGGIVTAAIFLLLYFAVFRPDTERVAARTDSLGLQERVTTMLQLENDESYLAKLQRDDAMKRLSEIKPSRLKIRFSVKTLIAALVFCGLTVGMIAIPFKTVEIVDAATPEVDKEESIIVEDLIKSLRDSVATAHIDDETRAQINQIIDELEKNISAYDTTIEKTAKILTAQEQIKTLIEEGITKIELGAQLAADENIGMLGEAIAAGDTEKVNEALDGINDALSQLAGEEQAELLDKVSDGINNAISAAGLSSEDDLTAALEHLGSGLKDSAESARQDEDTKEGISATIETAKQEIGAALESQNKTENDMNAIADDMQAATDKLVGYTAGDMPNRGEEKPGEENTDGENPDGENPDGNQPDEENPDGENAGGGGTGEENGDEDPGEEIESVFDPSYIDLDQEYTTDLPIQSGKVPYNEVYNDSYSDAMASIARGEIPANLRDIVQRYFSNLG